LTMPTGWAAHRWTAPLLAHTRTTAMQEAVLLCHVGAPAVVGDGDWGLVNPPRPPPFSPPQPTGH
jgi:hypothetical protein